jgi:hypothetical protein
VRHNKKRDANDLEIFRALQDAFCDPVRGNDCDIYCKSRADMKGLMLEVKSKSGTLRPIQKSLQELFQDRYRVVRSVSEALAACGVQGFVSKELA